VIAVSDGGYGSGGVGGTGGNGGRVEIVVAATGKVAGALTAQAVGGDGNGASNGGDIAITLAGRVTGDIAALSYAGGGNGEWGDSGDITVTISGTVDGKVDAWAAGVGYGTINVVLEGGTVTGVISAHNAPGVLTFDFDVADKAEFDAASTTLLAQQASGTLIINGKGYEWVGFGTLVNALRYAAPGDKVVVSVNQSASSTSPTETPQPAQSGSRIASVGGEKVFGEIPLITGKPEMAKCSGSTEVRTVRQDDGSIVVIHHSRGEDTLIGQLKDGEFRRGEAGRGWDVSVGNQGTSVDVSNGGAAISSCAFT